MTMPPRPQLGDTPNDIAIQTASNSGGTLTAIVSAVALLFSAYSLWDSSLKAPDLKVFVPPVIHYASPYNNTNFEVFEIPVTITNEGGRTGTVLSVNLEATNVKTGETKRFFSADFGRWTMEKARTNAFLPFAPISLAGKATRTETLLFHTKDDKEKPAQLVATEPGLYRFRLMLDEAGGDETSFLDRLWPQKPGTVAFEMGLRNYDARAFNVGSLPMYSTTGRSAKSGDAVKAK